jgi:hypothetical protein
VLPGRDHRVVFRHGAVYAALSGQPGVQEGILQRRDGISGDAQVGVTPFLEIMVVDIHPAGVADLSVDYDHLPVVAVIDLVHEIEDMHPWVGELDDLHTGLLHIRIVSRADRKVCQVLVEEADLYPFPCLLHEQVLDLPAALVVPEMEIFDVDGFRSFKYILAEQLELPLSAGDDLEIVPGTDGRVILPRHQPRERAEVLPDVLFYGMPEQEGVQSRCGLFLENCLVPLVSPVEYPVMPVVDTEHEIQDDSEEGEYGDDQQPRELPPRVSGIDQDDDTDGDYEEDVKDRE